MAEVGFARRLSLIGLVALFLAAGITHLVKPDFYLKLVPRFIPNPDAVVFWSGIVELMLATSLAVPRTRRVAALASMAFLVVVFPGNVQQALDARAGSAEFWVALARLPLQPLLIWWAYAVARAIPSSRI